MNKQMNQRINETLNQWISESITQRINELMNQWTNQSLNHWTDESLNHWINEPMNHWIMNEPINRWINESATKRMNEWVNWRLGGWVGGWMDGQMNGWMDGITPTMQIVCPQSVFNNAPAQIQGNAWCETPAYFTNCAARARSIWALLAVATTRNKKYGKISIDLILRTSSGIGRRHARNVEKFSLVVDQCQVKHAAIALQPKILQNRGGNVSN